MTMQAGFSGHAPTVVIAPLRTWEEEVMSVTLDVLACRRAGQWPDEALLGRMERLVERVRKEGKHERQP